jgi:hypothetical protein
MGLKRESLDLVGSPLFSLSAKSHVRGFCPAGSSAVAVPEARELIVSWVLLGNSRGFRGRRATALTSSSVFGCLSILL